MENYSTPFKSTEITRLTCGQLDVRLKTRFTNYKSRNPGGGIRGEVRELSRQSRSRLIYKARNTPGLISMTTFTYPSEEYATTATGGNFMEDGKVVKDHLRKLRQLFTYRDHFGFWFLEFQKRGAPHFHFITSRELSGREFDQVQRTWSKIVGSDCPHHPVRGCKHETLRKKHAAGAYAAKYSSKDEQKVVPDRYENVGRFWGFFGKPPETKTTISTSLKEIYRIARIARNARKAHARNNGYRVRNRGRQAGALYNAGPALRAYLERRYTIPGNPVEISVITTEMHNLALGCPEPGHTSETGG